MLATTLTEKISDPRNSKLYQSFMKMKIKKLLKQSKIITHQLKNLKTQSGIVEHPKTFHKLSKTKIQAEQVL